MSAAPAGVGVVGEAKNFVAGDFRNRLHQQPQDLLLTDFSIAKTMTDLHTKKKPRSFVSLEGKIMVPILFDGLTSGAPAVIVPTQKRTAFSPRFPRNFHKACRLPPQLDRILIDQHIQPARDAPNIFYESAMPAADAARSDQFRSAQRRGSVHSRHAGRFFALPQAPQRKQGCPRSDEVHHFFVFITSAQL